MRTVTLILFIVCGLQARTQTLNQVLITDFSQDFVQMDPVFADCINDHEWGNCVTIGIVKCAMAEFRSIKNIYREFHVSPDSISVIFNDGVKLSITTAEIQTAKTLAGMKHREPSAYYDSAMIVFTSICKRVLLRKEIYPDDSHCIHTFADAVKYINSGYATGSAGELLGLKLMPIEQKQFKNYAAAIVRTGAHTAYCTNGTEDFLGTSYVVTNNRMKNPIGPKRAIKAAYILSK